METIVTHCKHYDPQHGVRLNSCKGQHEECSEFKPTKYPCSNRLNDCLGLTKSKCYED